MKPKLLEACKTLARFDSAFVSDDLFKVFTSSLKIKSYATDLNAVFRVVEKLEVLSHLVTLGIGGESVAYVAKGNGILHRCETLCEAICLACAEYIRENENG
jgi:hypothetical protein